jgi:formate dehydrogenase subunit gamma
VNTETRLPRFDRTERVVHWTNAVLFLVLIGTGAALKLAFLATMVGHRTVVKDVHVYAGLLLPVPILAGIALRSGAQLRRDLGRLNRWTTDDRRWWSAAARRRVQLGKFNPGQKLNAAFTGAAIVVMLMTGAIMRWFEPFPDTWRTGATFVHDTMWLALCVVIAVHILLALGDADVLRAMVFGWVPETWARRERPRWWEEMVAEQPRSGGAVGDLGARAPERLGEPGVRAGEVAVGDAVDGRAGDGLGSGEL